MPAPGGSVEPPPTEAWPLFPAPPVPAAGAASEGVPWAPVPPARAVLPATTRREDAFHRLLRGFVHKRVTVLVPGDRHSGIVLTVGSDFVTLIEAGLRVAFIATGQIIGVVDR